MQKKGYLCGELEAISSLLHGGDELWCVRKVRIRQIVKDSKIICLEV